MYSRMILVRRIGTRIELLMIRSRESVQMMPFESFERKYIIDKFVSIPKQNEFPNDSVNPKIKLIRKHFSKSPLRPLDFCYLENSLFSLYQSFAPRRKNPFLLFSWKFAHRYCQYHRPRFESLSSRRLLEWNSPAWRL